MKRKKSSSFIVVLPQFVAGFAMIGIFGIVGVSKLHLSSAATATYSHSPVGYADYCRLSGTTTTVYGWAYDPDAPAGAEPYVNFTEAGATTKIPTNVPGYRDAAINAAIKKSYPGAPTNSTYGWKWSGNNIYKGSVVKIYGTVLNTTGTAGSNTTLTVHSGAAVDGNSANISFTTSSTIPDACLATKPVVAPPSGGGSTPPSGGSGTATPPKSGSTGSTKVVPKKTTVAPAAPVVPAPSANADATSTVGTTSAVITIPADTASKVHITYSETGSPSVDTDDQAVSGASTNVTLTGLDSAADYNYNIIRTNSAGAVATSPSATFTTAGYVVSLHFVDAKNKGVANIVGTINDANNTQVTTDDSGVMEFDDLPGGSYTVSYTYNGKDATKDFDTTTDTSTSLNADGSPATITLTDTINVDKIATAKKAASTGKKSSGGAAILFIILFILLVGGGIWFFLRWRRKRQLLAEYAGVATGTPAGMPNVMTSPMPPQPGAAQPLPAHAGESLRDMVLESMRTQSSQQPQVPEQPVYQDPLPPQSYAQLDAPQPIPQLEPTPQSPFVELPDAPAAQVLQPYNGTQEPAALPPAAPVSAESVEPANPAPVDNQTLTIHHDQ